MIGKSTLGRKSLLRKISLLTKELASMDAMFNLHQGIHTTEPMVDYFEGPSNKLDALVHACASEMATEVNNNGQEGQLEFLLRNGWTAEDILAQVRIEMEEDSITT